MHIFALVLISIICIHNLVNSAVIDDDHVDFQGLYSSTDQVTILTRRNFDKKIYGQNYAYLVQFYNSYCGHCRAFAPKYRTVASDIISWKNIIRLAVLDCSIDDNNEICREFEVLAYPSLRYIHENFVKGNGNIGDRFPTVSDADDLKDQLISKLRSEQTKGRLTFAPSLGILPYASYAAALDGVASDIKHTFFIFEHDNSTIGSELVLDFNQFRQVHVKRVLYTSELGIITGVNRFPALVVVEHNHNATVLTPKNPTVRSLSKAINKYLKSKNYKFPVQDHIVLGNDKTEQSDEKLIMSTADIVYYSDLEKAIKASLHTEITRYKVLNGETLDALKNYLTVLIKHFPFRGNLKAYIVDLHSAIESRTEWTGNEIYDKVISLEETHAPVYTSQLQYISCKGSQTKYRGYTCGLWLLFHTLTVNAARKDEIEGPRVLRAMNGFVKHFFGCTECSGHFQAMAVRNRLSDVKENDKAVLWLWISHNEVNLRLAGDITEDPEHPKIQFPSASKCQDCRLARGAWNLSAVYQYLQNIYGSENIRSTRPTRSTIPATSPFSNLDIGMLSLLYMPPYS